MKAIKIPGWNTTQSKQIDEKYKIIFSVVLVFWEILYIYSVYHNQRSCKPASIQ